MTAAHYRYYEHDADVGVAGRGPTLEEAFESAASGMFSIMTDISAVRSERTVWLEFEEADTELALVRWLNLLLAKAHEYGMVFCAFRLERDGVVWRGSATGESWRRELERGVEVKGATLTTLRVGEKDGEWEAQCVVDV